MLKVISNTGKNLLSHSFTSSFVTDNMDFRNLIEVQATVGYKFTTSTVTYYREKRIDADIQKVADDVAKERLKSFKEDYLLKQFNNQFRCFINVILIRF